jgi:lipopolysaccharide transport system permease protein
MLSDLLPYHRYIRQNALRDIQHRYAGTGLGLFWHVISPVLQISVYYYVFTQKMHIDYPLPGVFPKFSFAVYLCSGMLPWISFTEAVVRGTGTFQENATYLKKLPIPGPVFVAKTAAAATIQLAISVSVLVVLCMAVGLRPMWTWCLLPVICILWQTMGFGLGLLLGTLNVFFRDVLQVLIVTLQMWMWTLPIVYPDGDVQALALLNPPYAFVMAIRAVFLHGVLPATSVWSAMVAWTVVLVTAGMLVYRALQAELRDVL